MLTQLATQLDLLGQGPSLDNWSDLLVVVVMAVLWLGGALAKALSSSRRGPQQRRPAGISTNPGRPRETWHERLVRKAQEMQRSLETGGRQSQQEARVRTQMQKPRPARSRDRTSVPPAGRITVRPGRKGDSVMVYERPASKPATERNHQAARQREIRKAILAAGKETVNPPAVELPVPRPSPAPEPIFGGLAAVMHEPRKPLGIADVRSDADKQSAGLEPATLIDHTDPEALRKAILHYEILGKPLALRDPAEGISPF